jgi:hypothetical protein
MVSVQEATALCPKRCAAPRDIIRRSLNVIANGIGMALRNVGLTFPVFITVKNSGGALVRTATPLDPLDAHWQHAGEIVCQIMEKQIGCGRLRSLELACAVASGSIATSDVISR